MIPAKPNSILTPQEMTTYLLRHRARNCWGVMDEDEIKETISYFGDYWKLEPIDISVFAYVADPDYPNRSIKAHPLVHYFNIGRDGDPYCEIIDGVYRIGMARARRKRKMLAWVAHLGPVPDRAPPGRAATKRRSASQLRPHRRAKRPSGSMPNLKIAKRTQFGRRPRLDRGRPAA